MDMAIARPGCSQVMPRIWPYSGQDNQISDMGNNKNSLHITSEMVVTVMGDNDTQFVCVASNKTSDVIVIRSFSCA